ncbi:MAG: glycosyltransferase family 2 protein [Bacillota bacterium]
MRLLIAIPVYNERKTVSDVLDKVKRYHPEILVVDDGSTDGTGEILAARQDIQLIRHACNRGYGRSLIDAFQYADERGYDWTITMDCDEQHEPEMIPHFIREIQTDCWDIISGSRYMQDRTDNDLPPTDRRAINTEITELVNAVLGLHLTDAFCGFKAHRVKEMVKLALDEEGYAFPVQLWPRAVRAGLRIAEIPVRLIYKDPTRHFGGPLDDPDYRLNHYLKVLQAEWERPCDPLPADPISYCGCCCE